MQIRFSARIPIQPENEIFRFKNPAEAQKTLKEEFPTLDFPVDPPKVLNLGHVNNPALANTNGEVFMLHSNTPMDKDDPAAGDVFIRTYTYNNELYTKKDCFKAELVGISNIDNFDWTDYPFPE